MDTALFSSLIRNLLHTDIHPAEPESLAMFESRYCYSTSLQPFYQAETLTDAFSSMKKDAVYEYSDRLGTCVLLMSTDEFSFLVGPFLVRTPKEERLQETLISSGVSASYIGSLKHYLSSFPVVSIDRAVSTLSACIQSFTGSYREMEIVRIDPYTDPKAKAEMTYTEELDYSSIYRRYEVEDQFLQCIENGDTDNVLIAYDKMNLEGLTNRRYASAVYLDPSVGLAMLRTLCRKAAENGGASVVEIDEITQQTVQRLMTARNTPEMVEQMKTMIQRLTQAVRDSRERGQIYSPPIRKSIEYLRRNYSQKVSLETLAAHVNMSSAHLCRTFKKETSLTVTEYLTDLRCLEASRLLRETDYPVQEIAAYVGYPDNNYFVKVFRKKFDKTPTEYRNRSK